MPLLLYGARQVGKTFILLDFGEKNYENVVYINLETNRSVASLTAGPDLPRQRLFSHRPQELFKIQRVQGQALHFPHRKRILLPVDCHAEKTPGRYDMKAGTGAEYAA